MTIWCELHDPNMHIFQVDHFKDWEPGGHMMWWSMMWLLMPWGYVPGHLHPQSWIRCPLYPSNITNDNSSKTVSCAVWPNMATQIQVMAWCLCGARPVPEPIYPNISCPFSFIILWQDQMVGFMFLCVCVCIFCEFSCFHFVFLIWNSVHCYVQLCTYWCFFVQLLWWSSK